jgi:hypothetical protein
MKAGNQTKLPAMRWLLACGMTAAFGLVACNGAIGMGPGDVGAAGNSIPGAAGNGGPGASGISGGTAGIPGGAAGGAVSHPPVGGAGGGPVAGSGGTGTFDPGRVAIHRLNNLEYDNTMRDLLGFTGNLAQTTFQPDEKGEFDNAADAFTMNDARYEQYFNTADTIVEMVFTAAPFAAQKAKILSCTPSTTDMTCTRTIINGFGLRAWRRPMLTTEVDGLVTLAQSAVTLGENAEGSIKQVVKTMLATPQFLYRIEFDPNPASLMQHSLTPYELVTRLSYLGWSSMPDDQFFTLAQNNMITSDTVVSAQIDRMLADPKGTAFTQSFAGQWLGARDLKSHQVEPTAFATFDEPLRAAMVNEELSYFNEFLLGTLPMTQFFKADINFVDARLAKHYGVAAPPAGTTAKIMNTTDTRVGFMGLASFQTFTSYAYRTAPTLRGKWVLLNLLCQTIPTPPANVPKLDMGAATDPKLQSQNVRTRLQAHRAQTDCAACHATLDPIGLGLENFDAIGAFRSTYANGEAIDSSGVLPTKEMFNSTAQLADILSAGTYLSKLTDCASQKMMTYALSRSLTPADQAYLDQVRGQWAAPAQAWGLKALLKDIVLNDTFRFRRGEM